MSDTKIEAERILAAHELDMDGGPARGQALAFRTPAEVAAEVDGRPPRRYLFEPILPAGDYGVLSAPDKAGKTWCDLDAAVSCAVGRSWMGRFPCAEPGPVLGFFGEGGDAKILRRLRAVGVSKGLSGEETDALPIVLCFRAPQLSNACDRELIRQAVEQHRPALIILDPLYLAAGGVTGADLYAMGTLLGSVQRIAQEAGASLLSTHHWNKSGDGDGHHRSSGVGPGAWAAS